MDRFIFVGEKRSQKAIDMEVTWRDGHLAAKQLFDALLLISIDPASQEFCNIFTDDGELNEETVRTLRETPYVIVGMGKIVQDQLDALSIPHKKLVHPAARGKIRKKERYAEHVKTVLQG